MSRVGALGLSPMNTALRVEGAIEGTIFKTLVGGLLVPVWPPGDIVSMDTPTIHQGQGIEAASRATGAT